MFSVFNPADFISNNLEALGLVTVVAVVEVVVEVTHFEGIFWELVYQSGRTKHVLTQRINMNLHDTQAP